MKKIILLLIIFVFTFNGLKAQNKIHDQKSLNYYNIGNTKYVAEDYSGAITAFKTVLQRIHSWKNNKRTEAYVYGKMGSSTLRLGNFNDALVYLDKSISLFNENSFVYRDRGITRIALGDKNGGCEDLKTAREMGDLMAQSFIDKFCQYQ